MTDQSNAAQADADAQPQAGTPNDQQQASSRAQEPTDIKDLPGWAQKLIKDTRKEAGDYRTKAQQFEDANKTELQKRDDALKAADERASKAEGRARDLSARSAVTDAATKANAISTRAVYALIRSDLDFDDETGEPTNVDALLKAAQKEEPSLFRASNGSGDGGAGGGAGGDPNAKPDLNALLRQSMRR